MFLAFSPKNRIYLVPLLCLFFSLFTTSLMAQTLPSETDLQQMIAAIVDNGPLTAAQQADKIFLTDAIVLLKQINEEKKQALLQKQQLESIPTQLKALSKRELTQASELTVFNKQYESMNIEKLETLQSKVVLDIQSTQDALSNWMSKLTNLQILPERAQFEMSKNYQRSQIIRSRLNSGLMISDAEKLNLKMESTLLELKLTYIQKELDNRTNMQELAMKERDFHKRQLSIEEQKSQSLQQKINIERLGDTKRAAKKTGALVSIPSSPLLQKEQEINHQLSQQLIAAANNLSYLTQSNLQSKTLLERSTQTEQTLNEQVQMLKGNLLLSRILYQLYQQLENVPDIPVANLDEKIANIHVKQFELSQQRNELFQKEDYLDQLIASSNVAVTKSERESLSDLLDTRILLIDQLNRQYDTQLTNAINLQLTHQQLIQTYNSIELTLQQHIFWVSSNKAIDKKWFRSWPTQVYTQIKGLVNKIELHRWKSMWTILLPILLNLLLAFTLVWKRPLLDAERLKIVNELGRFRRDSQWHTPKALLYTVLQHIPGFLIIITAGLIITYFGFLTPILSLQITFNIAIGYLVLSVYITVMRPGNIGESHFGFTKSFLISRNKSLHYLWMPLPILIFLSTKAVIEPSSLGDDILGQTILLCVFIFLIYIFTVQIHRSIKEEEERSKNFLFAFFIFIILTLSTLVTFGYYYTVLKLCSRLIETFYLFLLWHLVYRTALRGLELAARRLAWKRAIAKRESKIQEDADGSELIEEAPMTLKEVNQQTLRLTRTLLFLIFSLLFYWLWSDLIAVFSYLDSVVLWSRIDTLGTIVPVSLSNVLSAIFTFACTWQLARNLPGLLEVLILSNLRLAQGTAYAITTMTNYILLGTGTLMVFSMLGMEWAKLQWLAAALTVGIGFGLQEIVANFVSGIIILFERPVRIGDTVTLGEYSGTVSKIRIRATTITDFNRKEVIVPNKAFVTERLINWSLSDTITRVIVQVGVAYGSDLQLTRSLLQKAAEENSRVLKEPEPVIYFLSFGASTLDHELRFFVRELSDRNPAIDELNRRIDELFKQNGIEIAFNQIDVHIKNDGNSEDGAIK